MGAFYFWLFPNIMFNFYPWGLSLNVVTPLAAGRTKVAFHSYVWNSALSESGVGAGLHRVEMEDEEVVESVQRGVRSRLYDRGRYSERREVGTHHFHELLADFMARPLASNGASPTEISRVTERNEAHRSQGDATGAEPGTARGTRGRVWALSHHWNTDRLGNPSHTRRVAQPFRVVTLHRRLGDGCALRRARRRTPSPNWDDDARVRGVHVYLRRPSGRTPDSSLDGVTGYPHAAALHSRRS